MYLLGALIYVTLCLGLAWFFAAWLTWRAKQKWVRWAVAALLAPAVFVAPFADEIVGKFQYERLCEEAKEVKIYGTIPVGEELYTPEGKWRIGLLGETWDRPQAAYEGLIRWDLGGSTEIPAAIPIHRSDPKIFEKKTGRILAEWREFSTPGGWLSQNISGGQATFLTKGVCRPALLGGWLLQQTILPYKTSTGETR